MPPPTEFASYEAQAPSPGYFATSHNWRELSSIVRRARREQQARLEASACRKRFAALMAGRFKGDDGWTDEEALDAFAPHPSDGLEPRVFTPEMDAAERKAWSRIETAKHKGRAPYREACRSYLRFVEGMERAAVLGLKPLSACTLQKTPLSSLKLGAMRRRFA